jgi:thioredoxin 1
MTTLDAAQRIPTLTKSTFTSRVLNGTGRIAVEFMSYGCAHCRAIEPVLQQVAAMIEPKEHVYRVNVAAESDLASRYAIGGTPTFIMFLDGNEVGRAEGPHPTVPSVMTAVTRPFQS